MVCRRHPRRNPELVVAVLWQNGEFSYYPARIGAKLVSAYVEKQRRLAHNLAQPAKTETPVEMSAVWTVPGSSGEPKNAQQRAEADPVETGSFLIDQGGQIVARTAPDPGEKPRALSLRPLFGARVGALPAPPPQPARKPETAAIGKGQ